MRFLPLLPSSRTSHTHTHTLAPRSSLASTPLALLRSFASISPIPASLPPRMASLLRRRRPWAGKLAAILSWASIRPMLESRGPNSLPSALPLDKFPGFSFPCLAIASVLFELHRAPPSTPPCPRYICKLHRAPPPSLVVQQRAASSSNSTAQRPHLHAHARGKEAKNHLQEEEIVFAAFSDHHRAGPQEEQEGGSSSRASPTTNKRHRALVVALFSDHQEAAPDHMKRKKAKASRAKKATAAAAARTSAPSPPRQVEQERLTMRARLSAFLPWFQVQPTPVVDDTNATTGDLAWGKKQRKRKKKTVHQAAMYGAPIEGPAKRAWKQDPAPRKIPLGPTIATLVANDAKIIEPYEQEFGHVDYLAIRSTNESGWDTCSACYFRQPSKIVPIKKKNLDKHFDRKHKQGGARERCSVCTAMLFTRHLKWRTKYCHLGS